MFGYIEETVGVRKYYFLIIVTLMHRIHFKRNLVSCLFVIVYKTLHNRTFLFMSFSSDFAKQWIFYVVLVCSNRSFKKFFLHNSQVYTPSQMVSFKQAPPKNATKIGGI